MKKQNGLFFAILFISVLFTNCKDDELAIYSNTRYRPLPKATIKGYKSPQEREGQNQNKAIGIAISGGGSRAQYFGLGVLIGLDEITKNGSKSILNEIDYYSTVSGGGFAAGYYMSLKKIGVLSKFDNFYKYWVSTYRKDTLQEFLYKKAKKSSVLKLWRYERNMIRKPYPNMVDYELLQYGKSYAGKEVPRLFLQDFFVSNDSSRKVLFPMFVPNGTVYNNGERIAFMPHVIKYIGINASILPQEPFTINNGYGLPLAYAISGSAAFPGVLPMLKFRIADNDSVLRVVDGGAVDNLGYMTLFELLSSDPLAKENKKAIIVDCGGLGNEMQKLENKKVNIRKLLKRALLYTVDINLLNSVDNINCLASYKNLDSNNIVRIGFSTIKQEYIDMEAKASPTDKRIVDETKTEIIRRKKGWTDLYGQFVRSFSGYTEENISELPSSEFEKLTLFQTFALFELSSQVETKIAIYPWEKEILVLAGRYATFKSNSKIQSFL
ncbi:MAG: patatin-like phospholipase family protein [Bacteroidia bacterium]